MLEQPIWKISSGKFAGWRIVNNLYDSNGINIGFFDGDIAYLLDGTYAGEFFDSDGHFGFRVDVDRPSKSSKPRGGDCSKGTLKDRPGKSIKGWEDPAC